LTVHLADSCAGQIERAAGDAPRPIAGAPASAPLTVEQQQLQRRRRLGAGWFYWVAGISLIKGQGVCQGLDV